MNKILMALRQRLTDLKAEGREKVEAYNALAAKDAPSDDDTAKIETLNTRIEALTTDIAETEGKITAEETRLDRDALFAPPATPAPTPARAATPGEQDPELRGGFATMADFGRAVMSAAPGNPAQSMDPRLAAMYQAPAMGAAPANFHQEGGAAEGYMVPAAFREEIWQLVLGEDSFLPMTDLEPTEKNAVQLLADETTPWGSTGIIASWRSEGVQMSASKMVTEGRHVQLHEMFVFVLATDELLEDAPRLTNRLTVKAAEAIRWKADDAIPYGTGAGQPLGYFNSGALISVAKETSQVADTVVVGNVTKMFSRMLSGSVKRAFWLTNSDVIPQLMTLIIGNQPMWAMPGSGMANAPGGFLLGRPILLTEHARTIGDKGDLQFVDFKGYYAANKRSGVKFDSSIHLFFDFGIQAFRWTFRLAGQPFLSAPVAAANGPNTKSHFVTLDERA